MRTSAGFREIGLSGQMRIHTRPPRLMRRVMARRAASIWRAVRRPRPMALRPYSPKLTLAPRVATPVLRPFCSLRYFLRVGCSMVDYSFPSLAAPSALDAAGLRTRVAGALASPSGLAAASGLGSSAGLAAAFVGAARLAA